MMSEVGEPVHPSSSPPPWQRDIRAALPEGRVLLVQILLQRRRYVYNEKESLRRRHRFALFSLNSPWNQSTRQTNQTNQLFVAGHEQNDGNCKTGKPRFPFLKTIC